MRSESFSMTSLILRDAKPPLEKHTGLEDKTSNDWNPSPYLLSEGSVFGLLRPYMPVTILRETCPIDQLSCGVFGTYSLLVIRNFTLMTKMYQMGREKRNT